MKQYKIPEWLQLLETFKNIEYGKIILYGDLNKAIMDGDIRTDKRYVFEKFRTQMLRQNQRALENVQNKGYRVVNPGEFTRLTNNEVKKAERRAKKAVDTILNAPFEKMTEKERAIATLTATKVQPLLAHLIAENTSLKHTATHYQLPEYPKR